MLSMDTERHSPLSGRHTAGSSRKRSLPSGGAPMSSPGHGLSCKRCRSRKVKCDTTFPACAGCSKAGVPCIVADYSTTREYTRSEVCELEERLYRLETLLDRPGEPATGTGRQSQHELTLSESTPGSELAASPRRYVGREVGVDFFQPMLEAIRKKSPAELNNVLAPESQTGSIIYHKPHTLPPRDTALKIVAAYFRDFHIAHPFLDALQVAEIFHRVYDSVSQGDAGLAQARKQTQQDLFQANMIMAIGSIGPFRAGQVQLHPFGFFTASLETNPPSEFSFGTILDVENLLLISQFGVFYNIGCSIWELSRLCMRICIELQLYKKNPGGLGAPANEEQRRRRVFWESYRLDRFSSATLGRPFAIDDSIVTIHLPEQILASEEDPPLSYSSITQHGWPTYHEASDRTVSNHLLTLSRITSGLHCFQQSKRSRARDRDTRNESRYAASGAEENFQMLYKLRGDLEGWRRNAPRYEHQWCLHQSSDYFELCFQKEKLYLIRVAIDQSFLKSSLPPQYLLRPCLSTAQKVIRTFNRLRLDGLVTYTRAYTHLIFTTSLIVVFLSFAQVHPQYQRQNTETHSMSQVDVESWWARLLDEGEQLPSQRDSLDVLTTAGDVLDWLARDMPDMRRYAQLLVVLRRELSKEINNASRQAMNGNIDSIREMRTWPAQDHMTANSLSQEILEMPTQIQAYDAVGGEAFGMTTPLDPQGLSPEGILFDLFAVGDLPPDASGSQAMNASWPFSQIPWIESINSDLSGYDGDFSIP